MYTYIYVNTNMSMNIYSADLLLLGETTRPRTVSTPPICIFILCICI